MSFCSFGEGGGGGWGVVGLVNAPGKATHKSLSDSFGQVQASLGKENQVKRRF